MFETFSNVKVSNNHLIISLMEIICNNEKYITKVNSSKEIVVEAVEFLI